MEKYLLDEIKKIKLFFDYNTNLTLNENLKPILLKENPIKAVTDGGVVGKFVRNLFGFGDDIIVTSKNFAKSDLTKESKPFKIGDDTYEIKTTKKAGFKGEETNKLYKKTSEGLEEVDNLKIGKQEFNLDDLENIATGNITGKLKEKVVNVVDEAADADPNLAKNIFDDFEGGLKIDGSVDDVHDAIADGMKINKSSYVDEVDNFIDFKYPNITRAEKNFIKKRYFGIAENTVNNKSTVYKSINKKYKSKLTGTGRAANASKNIIKKTGNVIYKVGGKVYQISKHAFDTFFNVFSVYLRSAYYNIRQLFTSNFEEFLNNQLDEMAKNLSKIAEEDLVKINKNTTTAELSDIRDKIKAIWRGTIQQGFDKSYPEAALKTYNELKTNIITKMSELGVDKKEIDLIFESIENTGSGKSIDGMIKSFEKMAEENTTLGDVFRTYKTKNNVNEDLINYFKTPFKKVKRSWDESVDAVRRFWKIGEGENWFVWGLTRVQAFVRECFKYLKRTITAIAYSSIRLPWEILRSYGKYVGKDGLFTLKNGKRFLVGNTKWGKLGQLAVGYLETNLKLALIKTVLYPTVVGSIVYFESLIEDANKLTNTKEDISNKGTVGDEIWKEFKEQVSSIGLRTAFGPGYDWNEEHFNEFVVTPTKAVYTSIEATIKNIFDRSTTENVIDEVNKQKQKAQEEQQKAAEELLKELKKDPNKKVATANQKEIFNIVDPEFNQIRLRLKNPTSRFRNINGLTNSDCERIYNNLGDKVEVKSEDVPSSLKKRFDDYVASKSKKADDVKKLHTLIKSLNLGIKDKDDNILKVGFASGIPSSKNYMENATGNMLIFFPKGETKPKPIKDVLDLLPVEDNQSNTGGQTSKQNTGGTKPNTGGTKQNTGGTKQNTPKTKQKSKMNENYIMNLIKKIIFEEEEKTLKMKDWDEIFTFQKMDDKNPGKFTDVKIKMDSVMDRIPHWRKKYKKQCEEMENCDDDGEDDSFVRAVIDTHPDVVRILFTKGLAHLVSSEEQEDLNEGLHGLLSFIREAKNVEVEVWSVYRHPSSPDKIWSLVKGDYKPKELESMDVKMQQSPGNSVEKKKNSLDELKKKESDAISVLSSDEKKGLMGLPIKLRNKIKDKIKLGWTTEKPSEDLIEFHRENEVDSVLSDPIKIYKLRPNSDFFDHLEDNSLSNNIKRGFCRAIYYVKKELDLSKSKKEKIESILDKCENKFEGKYGQNYL